MILTNSKFVSKSLTNLKDLFANLTPHLHISQQILKRIIHLLRNVHEVVKKNKTYCFNEHTDLFETNSNGAK